MFEIRLKTLERWYYQAPAVSLYVQVFILCAPGSHALVPLVGALVSDQRTSPVRRFGATTR